MRRGQRKAITSGCSGSFRIIEEPGCSHEKIMDIKMCRCRDIFYHCRGSFRALWDLYPYTQGTAFFDPAPSRSERVFYTVENGIRERLTVEEFREAEPGKTYFFLDTYTESGRQRLYASSVVRRSPLRRVPGR